MALTDKQLLGKWLTYSISVRIFNGKKFAVQSTGDGGIIPRGRNIMKNADATRETGITDTLLDELEPSDDYGTNAPLSFVTPEGYTKVSKGGATIYYPDALIEQNPSLATGGITTPRSAETALQKAWAWIQANPLQSGVIAFILYVFIIEPLFLKKKGKKSLLGKLF